MPFKFLQLSAHDTVAYVSGDRVGDGGARGQFGFFQSWQQQGVESLSDGLSANVSWVVFPVNEDGIVAGSGSCSQSCTHFPI